MEKVIKHLVFSKKLTKQQYEQLIEKFVSSYNIWKSENDAMEEHFENSLDSWTGCIDPNWRVCEILQKCHKISARPITNRVFAEVADSEYFSSDTD